MSVEGERGRKVASREGNIVAHEPASDSSTVQNVLGFIQDYVPQAVTGAKGEKKEKVLWAHFETAALSEIGRCQWNTSGGGGGGGGGGEGRPIPDTRQDPLLLIVGVASGFSIWHIPPAGDAREVYCCYGDGETARTARLLPTPDPSGLGDQFVHLRPILAVVKKGRLGGGTVPYSTLQLLSLSATDTDTLVKKFQFKGKPILGLHSNQRVLVVVFRKRVLVIDSLSLAVRFSVRNDYPVEHLVNPVALGPSWLALSEIKLNSRYSTRGGVCLTQLPSVTTTVMKNVRKGLTALSDTLSGLTGMVQSTSEPSDSPPQPVEYLTANVVTVLDITYDHPEELKLHEAGRKLGGVVAHFQATAEHGSHIAALTFDPSGTLLVTASTEGHLFNVFQLIPHPWLSTESAVHHLYTLFRGATLASVTDISVSCDSRWVAVSTLNGTSHLFPITPYGGEITVRTHTSNRVVNRMSRFHTSAGIETVATRVHSHSAVTPPPSAAVSTSPTSHTSHSPPHHERQPHPSAPGPLVWNNPRTTTLPLPLTVRALYQIKQPYLSSDEGSKGSVGVASGGGHAHSSPSSPGDQWPGESQCVRVFFSSSSSPSPSSSSSSSSTNTSGGSREWSGSDSSVGSAVYTVFVLGGSGSVTCYSLLPRPHEEAREGNDAPIALDCHAHICWRLLSKPHPLTTKLPLPEDNPLISATAAVSAKRAGGGEGKGGGGGEGGRGEGEWLSEVELVTHATPTRRLWMGPQFSFKTYTSHTPLPVSSPRQAGLSESGGTVVPATGNLISLSPDSSHQRLVSAESGESAVLSPSHDSLLSDLLQQPPELTSLHTSPIPMPPRTGSHSREHGMEPGSHSMERGMVEVYGSWNKMAPRLEASQTTDVAQQLAEAMSDHTLSSLPTQPQITMATRKSSHRRTGFQTVRDHHQ